MESGSVNLNLSGSFLDNSDGVPRPHHPAFWAHLFFLLAAGFLLLTYLGGFRRLG